MKYRVMTGEQVSVLGLGCMRLPTINVSGNDKIDEETFTKMVEYSYNNGINYFDTAYMYHNGTSEVELGKVLNKLGIREKVYVADKLPPWEVNKKEDVLNVFNEQLDRVQTDYFDFYLLHSMTRNFWDSKIREFDVLETLKSLKADGKIKHLGFSFHDDLEAFKYIIDSSEDIFEFCQIQLNYADAESGFQAGLEGLRYANEQGLSVVVMEPLRGGQLANTSPHIENILPKDKPIVELALDFLWDMPEVTVVLSGMGNMEQLKENIEYAKRSHENMLSDADRTKILSAGESFNKGAKVNCTACAYCMPCPMGVNIPDVFRLYNEQALLYSWENEPKKKYSEMEVQADACVKCEKCLIHCPQHISIPEKLEEAAKALSK